MIFVEIEDPIESQKAGMKITRKTIVTDEAIPNLQRIYGQSILKMYACDEKGNKLQNAASPSGNPALIALRERAKGLKIKGYHLMSEEKLVEAIQKEYQKQTASKS